jgi:hypothetical protein
MLTIVFTKKIYINGVGSNPVEGRTKKIDSSKI